jgi:hypothetical protein
VAQDRGSGSGVATAELKGRTAGAGEPNGSEALRIAFFTRGSDFARYVLTLSAEWPTCFVGRGGQS